MDTAEKNDRLASVDLASTSCSELWDKIYKIGLKICFLSFTGEEGERLGPPEKNCSKGVE